MTSAASGIGEATARLFAEHGAYVTIADIEDELGHQVASSIGFDWASYWHCDVRDEKQVKETVTYTVKYEALHVMSSNAGIMGPLAGIMEMDIDVKDCTPAVNLQGSALAIKSAERAMVASKTRGSIICTSSVSSTIAGTRHHPYTVSKHGLLGLIRSAASEPSAIGIRANCVSPYGQLLPMACGLMNLEPAVADAMSNAMAKLKGITLKARHVADADLFLASDESAYVSGDNLAVDGGVSVVSAVASRNQTSKILPMRSTGAQLSYQT